MDEDPGPSTCKRPLLEGNSDGENAWLSSWDSLGRPASLNRALLWDLMDILAKPKFREEFKLGFKAVVGADWNDSDLSGKELEKKLGSIHKSKFKKTFNTDQRPLVLSGQILEWDITLLRAAIQALIDASNSKWNPANLAEIVALKNLRNNLCHKGAHHFKDDEFEPMYETFKNNVKKLGWTAEDVDAARKHLTMPKNVFACEAPKKFFYGRQDKLRDCKEAIQLCLYEKNAKDRIVAIQGFGGMGKTQIARSMGQILRSDEAAEPELSFDVIFSFDAQTEISLEKGFKDLAQHLGIPDKLPKSGKLTSDDISRIYVHLGRYYKHKVLFIFDNAEQLKPQNGKFGLKTYLGPRNDCHGPVFLVTSRDPWHLWIHSSKCVKVEELAPGDARSCLLGYMCIPEKERESEDLKEPFASLVDLIGGHPLGLKLCGSAIEKKVKRSKQNSNDWIHGVKDYLYLLRQKPLCEFSGEAKYKERVRIICQDTLAKIIKDSQGSTATALLGIIANLSPDDMKLGLVKCIHINENPGSRLFWAEFKHLPSDMQEEMNLLLGYSLIDLYDSGREIKISTSFSPHTSVERCVLVKIHRLVQECTRKLIQSEVKLTPELDPLQKIITFSDRNNLPKRDAVFILNSYANNHSELSPLDDESKWKLCSRIAEDKDSLKAMDPALEDLARNDEEKDVVKLLLLRSEWYRGDSEYFSDLYDVIQKLCFHYDYRRRDWFIELCSSLLSYVTYSLDRRLSPQDDKDKVLEISGWVLQGYLRCEIIRDISDQILRVANFVVDNGGSIEPILLPKIFSKSTLKHFWDRCRVISSHKSQEWLACLFPCHETNLFTTSLQSLEESRSYDDFTSNWGQSFCSLLNNAASYPQLRCRLSQDRNQFVPTFWKMTEWIFGSVTPNNTRRHLIPLILCTWCGLFSGDESLYDFYHLLLDNKVAVWLQLIFHVSSDPNSDYTSMKNFASCTHCSAETKRWIDIVYRGVQPSPWESELESEESSELESEESSKLESEESSKLESESEESSELESESEEPDAPVTIMENDN